MLKRLLVVLLSMSWSMFWWLAPAAWAQNDTGREAGRAHYQRGMAQYELDHYQEAINEFEAGFAASPEPAFLYNLATVHAKMGHKQEALKFYRKYLDHDPPQSEIAGVQAAIDKLERELLAPPPAPQIVAPVIVEQAAPPPKRKRRVWPIVVGVVAAGAVVGVVVGLSVGLTRSDEPVLQWSAR